MSARTNDIRKEILMQLYAVRPLSLTPARLQRDARKAGYDYTVPEISAELQFLEDEECVVSEREPGQTGKLYRIAGRGVKHYEEKYS